MRTEYSVFEKCMKHCRLQTLSNLDTPILFLYHTLVEDSHSHLKSSAAANQLQELDTSQEGSNYAKSTGVLSSSWLTCVHFHAPALQLWSWC